MFSLLYDVCVFLYFLYWGQKYLPYQKSEAIFQIGQLQMPVLGLRLGFWFIYSGEKR